MDYDARRQGTGRHIEVGEEGCGSFGKGRSCGLALYAFGVSVRCCLEPSRRHCAQCLTVSWRRLVARHQDWLWIWRRGFDVFVNMVLEDVEETEITPDGKKVTMLVDGACGRKRDARLWQWIASQFECWVPARHIPRL